MTKNQIEYNLGMSQLQQRYAELENEQKRLALDSAKWRQQQYLDYGAIINNKNELQGYDPTGGYVSRKAEADIAAAYAAATKAYGDERYGGGALGDLRRGLESMFPFLKTYGKHKEEEGGKE